MSVVYFFCHKTASSIGTMYWDVCVRIIYVCVCVDFGAGWLWFIRSPLKNRCGKGNEMHKKHGVCVLSVSDHGFFFTIHYPRLCACICAWVKKKRAFEPVVLLLLLLLFLVYARVASWFIACRGFTYK